MRGQEGCQHGLCAAIQHVLGHNEVSLLRVPLDGGSCCGLLVQVQLVAQRPLVEHRQLHTIPSIRVQANKVFVWPSGRCLRFMKSPFSASRSMVKLLPAPCPGPAGSAADAC